jgi:hypothetical protein
MDESQYWSDFIEAIKRVIAAFSHQWLPRQLLAHRFFAVGQIHPYDLVPLLPAREGDRHERCQQISAMPRR